MIKTIESSEFDCFIWVGVRLEGQLHQLGLRESEQSVEQLRELTQSWLGKQLEGNNDVDIFQRLLWPFELALSILRRPDKGRSIKADDIKQLLQEYLPW